MDEAFCLLASLRPYPHRWSRGVGSDQKNRAWLQKRGSSAVLLGVVSLIG